MGLFEALFEQPRNVERDLRFGESVVAYSSRVAAAVPGIDHDRLDRQIEQRRNRDLGVADVLTAGHVLGDDLKPIRVVQRVARDNRARYRADCRGRCREITARPGYLSEHGNNAHNHDEEGGAQHAGPTGAVIRRRLPAPYGSSTRIVDAAVFLVDTFEDSALAIPAGGRHVVRNLIRPFRSSSSPNDLGTPDPSV